MAAWKKRLRLRGKRIICLSKDCRHRPNNNDFHQLAQFRWQLFQENEEISENLICILMCKVKIKLNFLSFVRIKAAAEGENTNFLKKNKYKQIIPTQIVPEYFETIKRKKRRKRIKGNAREQSWRTHC